MIKRRLWMVVGRREITVDRVKVADLRGSYSAIR